MDKIIMKGMKFFGYHGVLPREKEQGQIFEVDLLLYLDFKIGGLNDDLNNTVDYAGVFEMVKDIVAGDSYNLIETVAENISSRIMAGYPQIKKINVSVKKPSAPLNGTFDYVAVEIIRERED